MKIKTADLIDEALDWAVATAQGIDIPYTVPFSSVWMYGGPIIDREKISIRQWDNVPDVHAYLPEGDWVSGPTPLIAAMRCFVMSKLGDEVEVPKELIKQEK